MANHVEHENPHTMSTQKQDTCLPPKKNYQFAILKPRPTYRIHRKNNTAIDPPTPNTHHRGVIPIQYTIQTATRYRPVWQGPALSLSSVETVLRWSIHHERSQ